MTIDFLPDLYYSAIWFVNQPWPHLWETKPNFLGALFRHADGRWEFRYRFAYYNNDGDQVGAQWHQVYVYHGDQEREGQEMAHFFAKASADINGSAVEFIPLNCPGDEAFAKIADRRWAKQYGEFKHHSGSST
jgi:hypothetical protein